MDIRETGVGVKRVLVVDSDPDTRLRIREILRSADDFKLAGDFSNVDEALSNAPRLKPNLVLLGVRLPAFKDIGCIKRFKRILVGLKIIAIVSGVANTDLVESSLRAGVEDCLVKPLTAGQCLATLRFARCRHTESQPNSLRPHLDASGDAISRSCLTLSQRENEVLDGLAEGLLYKEIADKLAISYSAVHKYQHNLFTKLRVSNRSEAIRYWLGMTTDNKISLGRNVW